MTDDQIASLNSMFEDFPIQLHGDKASELQAIYEVLKSNLKPGFNPTPLDLFYLTQYIDLVVPNVGTKAKQRLKDIRAFVIARAEEKGCA